MFYLLAFYAIKKGCQKEVFWLLTYLRSTMGEERLVGLTHMTCNKDIEIEFDVVIIIIIFEIVRTTHSTDTYKLKRKRKCEAEITSSINPC